MPNCDAPGSGSDSLRPRSQNVRKRTPSKAGALVTPPTVSRSLRRDTGSTATVNWLPTSYTWSKHFRDLRWLLLSPKSERAARALLTTAFMFSAPDWLLLGCRASSCPAGRGGLLVRPG